MEVDELPWGAYAESVGEVFTIFHGDYGYAHRRHEFKQVIRDHLKPYDVYPTFIQTLYCNRETGKALRASKGGEPVVRFRVRAMDTGWKETLRRHNLSSEGK